MTALLDLGKKQVNQIYIHHSLSTSAARFRYKDGFTRLLDWSLFWFSFQSLLFTDPSYSVC